MQTKSIWYISKYATTPSTNGVGARGFFIMRELSKIGYNCLIITSDSNRLGTVPNLVQSYEIQFLDGLQILWVKTLKYRAAKSILRIFSWLHFEWRLLLMPTSDLPKPDAIVVSSLSLLTILNGFLLRRQFRARLIFEIRDIWPLTLTEQGGFGQYNPFVLLLGLVEKLGYRYADAIVGTMPNLGEHVNEVLGQKRFTEFIPMGFSEEPILENNTLPDSYLNEYIPKDKFLVGYVGTIGFDNALDTLFFCAESMQNESNIHFLLVGDGSLLQIYQKKFSHLPNLTFAPRIPSKFVHSVLNHCDILYFSTHQSKVWHFGQSLNKLVDYMLSGKPVVASFNGYQSMINEAGCGVYLPPGDQEALKTEILQMSHLTKDDLQQIGFKGRSWLIKNRSYEKLAKDYLSILFPQ
jgi:glycosyltransferase involved in cell wall biosynthesis